MVTFYFFAGQNEVESRWGLAAWNPINTPMHSQYIWSLLGVKTPLLEDTTFGTGGVPTTAGRPYYLTDANANVTGLVQESGGTWGVRQRNVYSPYGTVTYCTPSWTVQTLPTVANTLLFASMDFAGSATGLYYDNARWYDAGLGRLSAKTQLQVARTFTATAAIDRQITLTRRGWRENWCRRDTLEHQRFPARADHPLRTTTQRPRRKPTTAP